MPRWRASRAPGGCRVRASLLGPRRQPSVSRDLCERAPIAIQRRLLPRRLLPPTNRDIDVRRRDLDRAAPTARALSGDELRATAAKRFEHDVARLRVLLDGAHEE